VAPPPVRPPKPEDLEALIEEARRRTRRRRLAYAALILILGAAGALFAVFGSGGRGGSTSNPRGHGSGRPLSRAREFREIERGAAQAPIGESGLVAPNMGWGMNGIGLWLTLDGGRTWRTITPPNVRAAGDAVARIIQIQFVDPHHGWISAADIPGDVVLANGSLRHMAIDLTTDGGKTWRSVIPPGCVTCGGAQLSFLDAHRGFALLSATPEPKLYATTGGGATWRLIGNPPFDGTIRFVDRKHAFAVSTGAGLVYETSNGGRTWYVVQLVSPPALQRFAKAGVPQPFGKKTVVVPVRFRNPKSNAQRLIVYVTTDGGMTWSPRPAPAAANLRAYSFGGGFGIPFSAASANDWILFVGQTIYETTSAGRKWSRVHVRYAPKPPAIWDVDFTSRLAGWAIFGTRNGPALVRTVNGGRDWMPLTPPVPQLRP
jgi:photosystem II stability/assembly factor-like uncharacterized protein